MRYAIGMHIFWNSENATAAVRHGRQYGEKRETVSLSAEDRSHPSSCAPHMSYGI